MLKTILLSLSLAAALAGCRSAPTEPPIVTQYDPSIESLQIQPEDPEAGFEEPVVEAENGIRLRLEFKKGAKIAREMVARVSVEQLPGSEVLPAELLEGSSFSLRFTTEVASVDGGVATLNVDGEKLHVEYGPDAGFFAERNSTIRVDPRGRVLDDADAIISGLHGVGLIIFPEKRIAEGSSWSNESFRSLPATGDVLMKETYTYRGTVREGSERLHKVDVAAEASLPGFKLSGSYFYGPDGFLRRADLKQETQLNLPTQTGEVRALVRFDVKVRPVG